MTTKICLSSEAARIQLLYELALGWRTREELAAAIGFPVGLVTQLLRQLRKREYGSHLIGLKRMGGREWVYRLMDPKPRRTQ